MAFVPVFRAEAYSLCIPASSSWNPTARNPLRRGTSKHLGDLLVNGIIYLVGLIVVVMAILSFLGLH
jgi:hypothetical protein